MWVEIAQVGIATCCWLGGPGDRIPVEVRFSSHVQAVSEVHPASYTMGTGSVPGVERPGHGVNHQLHLAPKLKEE